MVGARPSRARRALQLLALCLFVAAAWYGISYRRDFIHFYFQRDTQVRSASDLQRELQGTGWPMTQLGQVKYGATAQPLWVLHEPASATDIPTVCLMAGIHGNEPAGTAALVQLAKELSGAGQQARRVRHVLLPMANPWGWERDLRHNGSNDDIARQFIDGDSQESRLVKHWIKAEHCDLLVDLHEDRYHEGFYLLAYDEPDGALLDRTLQTIETQTGLPRSTHAPDGAWRVPKKAFSGIKLTTASLWARMNGVPHALIVETPEGLPLATRVQMHRLGIAGLTELVNPGASKP